MVITFKNVAGARAQMARNNVIVKITPIRDRSPNDQRL